MKTPLPSSQAFSLVARSMCQEWTTGASASLKRSLVIGVTCFFILMANRLAQAATDVPQGPVAAVQSTLKEQQFYFGEVTGEFDADTRAALRRFQVHRGLPMTAEMDSATMQSLQSAASETESRSVRGQAQETVQDDKRFLQELESNEQAATAPRAPVLPPPVAESGRSIPALRPAAPENSLPPQGAEAMMSAPEAERFIRAYLNAAEEPTPAREASFYGDQVSYFDSGVVGRRFVEKDQRNYYRRWPIRRFTLLGSPEIVQAAPDRTALRFRIRYEVEGPQGSAKGETENFVKVRKTSAGPQIIGIHERKLDR